MKRSPMPQRRQRLNRMSDKKAAERRQRREVVMLARRRDNDTCQGRERVPSVACFGDLDPHEIIPRGVWRAGYLVLDNVVMICRGHHDWTHANPDAAVAAGLRRWSWER